MAGGAGQEVEAGGGRGGEREEAGVPGRATQLVLTDDPVTCPGRGPHPLSTLSSSLSILLSSLSSPLSSLSAPFFPLSPSPLSSLHSHPPSPLSPLHSPARRAPGTRLFARKTLFRCRVNSQSNLNVTFSIKYEINSRQ